MSHQRQREHQANEQTFLARLRTAVALMAQALATARSGLFLREIESAIAQAFSLEGPRFNSPTLGLSLVIFGLIVISLPPWRYQQIGWQMKKQNIPQLAFNVVDRGCNDDFRSNYPPSTVILFGRPYLPR